MDLATRLATIKERLTLAAQQSGRQAGDITLIAVSKTHPAEAVIEAALLGQQVFGESYSQEALAKISQIQASNQVPQELKKNISWHFIGHLQSRKAKDVMGRFQLIHTIDSLKLAQALQNKIEQLASMGDPVNTLTQDVLVQVNIGSEPQKSGISEADLPALVEQIKQMPNLQLKGLMCIPPFDRQPEEARPYFAQLRHLRNELENDFGKGCLPHLSMGMSQDFEIAIEEGATLVRVGTDIFGSRPVL